MPFQERMPFRPKDFWTSEERILLQMADDQTAIIQAARAEGEPWKNNANTARKQMLPKLEALLATPGLSGKKLGELNTTIRNLQRAISDSSEPSTPAK